MNFSPDFVTKIHEFVIFSRIRVEGGIHIRQFLYEFVNILYVSAYVLYNSTVEWKFAPQIRTQIHEFVTMLENT